MRRSGIFWHKSLIKLIWNQTIFICSSLGREKRRPDGRKRMLVYKSIEFDVSSSRWNKRYTNPEHGTGKLTASLGLRRNAANEKLGLYLASIIIFLYVWNIAMPYSTLAVTKGFALIDISVRLTELTQASNITADPAVDWIIHNRDFTSSFLIK